MGITGERQFPYIVELERPNGRTLVRRVLATGKLDAMRKARNLRWGSTSRVLSVSLNRPAQEMTRDERKRIFGDMLDL